MPKDQLESLLDDLKIQESSIKGTARFILSQPASADESVRRLVEHLEREEGDKPKIVYLYVIHEILVQNNDLFIKTIGQQLKHFIQILSDAIPQVGQQQKIVKLINVWKDLQIYHPSFIEKLHQIIYVQIQLIQKKTRQAPPQQPPQFSKAQIRDYKLIQNNPLTKNHYECLSQEDQLQQRINHFNATLSTPQDAMLDHTRHVGQQLLAAQTQLLQDQNHNYQLALDTLDSLRQEYQQFSYAPYHDLVSRMAQAYH